MVGVGREELRDKVAVACVYLHRVETCVVGSLDSRAKVLGKLPNLLLAHTAMEGGRVEVETVGCRYGEATRCRPVGHISAVAKLNTYGSTLVVYRIGQVAQSGDNLITQP